MGSVRNPAPFADHSAYAAAMSATLMLRNALAWPGPADGASVTAGLSSVGPPLTLRISQLLTVWVRWDSRS